MGNEDNPDQEIIARLRDKAEQLERLESRLKRLEQEYQQLADSQELLSGQLARYHRSLTEWEWFFEHSVQMLCIAGLDGYFKRVNSAFADALGYTKEELMSRPFIEFVHADDVPNTLRELQGLGSSRDSINFENRYLAKDGSWRWIAWHCPAISNVTTKLFAIARDITEDRRKEAAILYKASHDSLTGLHNRAAFEENLEDAIAQQERNPTGEVVLYLVDGNTQELGYYPCEPLAERIIAQASEPVELSEGPVTVGCSVGIATFPGTAADFGSLISQADKAMYATKKAGKNGFRKFDSSLN
ncbi:PAS domain S-box protein [Marinobacter sp. TBZ242]|uniref:PAS domain S-box protein n=1 Tax=Marinobacter azerbaijanicus TaxID=3050455 RepID=A0ABT7IIC2_9GAMM|nr:PAS domain S-box protein [Marinobacter sp. TBZ242]MDL0432888.1 PAS domain S-box protein [Marinobacter sp. TBZ242]